MSTIAESRVAPKPLENTTPLAATPRASDLVGYPIFFAFAGFVVAIMFADSIATHWSGKIVTGQWMAIGAAVPLYMLAYALKTLVPRVPSWLLAIAETIRLILACGYVSAGVWLAIYGHRYLFLSIAIVQALLMYALLRSLRRTYVPALALVVTAAVSWMAAAPLSNTALQNLLLDASTSTSLLAIAFIAALVLTVFELVSDDAPSADEGSTRSAFLGICVGLGFLELSLRTDGLLTDWIPYHRSYFTEPATFVRLGHWLLWDVPSQYGFLSILAIALTPGATTWQSTYVLTAIILTAQSLMLFFMLRSGKRSLLNLAFSTLMPAAIFLEDQAYRWPFGPRLYPQHGVRFVWVYVLLFAVFQRSVARSTFKRHSLTLFGYAAWTLGCLWAFESAIWCTLIWGTYMSCDAAVKALRYRTIGERARQFLPLLCFPAIIVVSMLAIDAYYVLRLGHGPDWQSFVEFSAIYTGYAPNSPFTSRLGPGWLLLILLGGVGTPLIVAVSQRKWIAVPPLAAGWMAAWGTCVYFAGETFANHVNALVGIFAFVFATIARVSRDQKLSSAPTLTARASFVPVPVILLAAWLGNGGGISKGHAPLLPGYRFDQGERVATISGELAALMGRARITPGDSVILPDSVGWTKLDTGLLMPFARDKNGRIQEIVAWLPVGPGGANGIYATITADRRRIYANRFLSRRHAAGWLITYHEPARCATFAPQTSNDGVWESPNYNVTHCVFRPGPPSLTDDGSHR